MKSIQEGETAALNSELWNSSKLNILVLMIIKTKIMIFDRARESRSECTLDSLLQDKLFHSTFLSLIHEGIKQIVKNLNFTKIGIVWENIDAILEISKSNIISNFMIYC
jgi:hypothetical protein